MHDKKKKGIRKVATIPYVCVCVCVFDPQLFVLFVQYMILASKSQFLHSRYKLLSHEMKVLTAK